LWKQESFVVLRSLRIEFFRNLLGIFRLRSFFASRRSYSAQDDSARGEMGVGCEWSRALAEPESK